MSKKRAQYSIEFKAKLALVAIRGGENVSKLASRYGIHPAQVNNWKRHWVEQAAELFACSNGVGKGKGSINDLHRVIGQLTVKRDFFGESAKSLNVTFAKLSTSAADS